MTGGKEHTMAKQFQCPFCAFNVTAEGEDEVLKHVQMHKADRHPDKDVSEEDILDLIHTVKVHQRS